MGNDICELAIATEIRLTPIDWTIEPLSASISGSNASAAGPDSPHFGEDPVYWEKIEIVGYCGYGAYEDPGGDTCVNDASCEPGEICSFGICVAPCLIDSECPSGQQCFGDCVDLIIEDTCTSPGLRPFYTVLFESCGGVNPIEAQEIHIPMPNSSNGFSLKWTLPGGTYYYPVYSASDGFVGEYQLLVTAEQCSPRPCCVDEFCLPELTIFDCNALGGEWMSAVPLCDGEICSEGACCVGPDQCTDGIINTAMECNGLNPPGVFHPGQDCADISCTPCATNGDGSCSLDNSLLFMTSDYGSCLTAADDVTPIATNWPNTTPTGLCWRGAYHFAGDEIHSIGATGVVAPSDFLDCNNQYGDDLFTIKVYEDDGGKPGDVIAGKGGTVSFTALERSNLRVDQINGISVFEYNVLAPNGTPATFGLGSLSDGVTYWLEIVNDGSSTPGCHWVWAGSANGKNDYSLQSLHGEWDSCDRRRDSDLSFCIAVPDDPKYPVEFIGGNGNIEPCAPQAAPYPHNRAKNRYISFAPNNGFQSVAFRVQKAAIANGAGFCTGNPGAACTGAPTQGTCPSGSLCVAPFPSGSPAHSCWVQSPVLSPNGVAAHNNLHTAMCGNEPVYRIWNEQVIHVGDCEIIPTSSYEVRSTTDGVSFSDALSLSTIAGPSFNSKIWGDIVGINNGAEWTPPNRYTNVHDVLAILAIIAQSAIRPHFTVANIANTSTTDSCLSPQANVGDVLAVNRAIGGNTYGSPDSTRITDTSACDSPGACCDKSGPTSICTDLDKCLCESTGRKWYANEGCEVFDCDAQTFAPGGGGGNGFAPEGFGFTTTPTFDLTSAPYQIDAGETATIGVYLDASGLLSAYEASLDLTGGTTGSVSIEEITINTAAPTYLFAGQSVYLAIGVEANLAGSVLANELGFAAAQNRYLATFTLRASPDAFGVFEVQISGERSFLLDEEGLLVEFEPGETVFVRVGTECTDGSHCVDGNQCTSDVCTNGECSNANLASGTACNDELFCTKTDTCNGSGVCVGSVAKPCVKPNPVCCEETDTCHPTGYNCGLED